MRSVNRSRLDGVRALAAVVIAVAAMVVGHPGTASASCVGHILRVPKAELVRGELITIDGIGFGDNCYDTGSPPDGEGTLGRPLPDVTISFVQGATRIDVARGNADAKYELHARVRVPASLDPGPVVVEARSGTDTSGPVHMVVGPRFPAEPTPLSISTSPPSADAATKVEVVSFGPRKPATAEIDPNGPFARTTDDSTRRVLVIGAAIVGVAALLAVGGFFVLRRRRADRRA